MGIAKSLLNGKWVDEEEVGNPLPNHDVGAMGFAATGECSDGGRKMTEGTSVVTVTDQHHKSCQTGT